MHTGAAYRSLALSFRSTTRLAELLGSIPVLSMAQRKDILTLCRVQSPQLLESSVAYAALKCRSTFVPHPCIYERSRGLVMSFDDYIGLFYELFSSPTIAGLVSLAVRTAPGWDVSEVKQVIQESIRKEISSAITIYHPTCFDYRVLFHPNNKWRSKSLAPNLPPYPEAARDIFLKFSAIKGTLEREIFFPNYSRKSVGKEVSDQFWNLYNLNPSFSLDEMTTPEGGPVALIDIEKLWIHNGFKVGGAVEMRCSWRYNDLKPRVYYARGGSIHWRSRYIQEVVNILIDQFPEVNRLSRFDDFEERTLDEDTSVFIYDYSSFTSTMEEFNCFVSAVAEFFRGTWISVYDLREGLVEIDLGSYIHEYLEEANIVGRFVVRGDIAGWDIDLSELRNTCGMLGVPGNIFFATLLHGLHLRFITGLRRSRCVGDDAKGKVPARYNGDDLAPILSNLGEVHPDKTNWFTPDGSRLHQRYQFAKRPYFRDDIIMSTGILPTFPSYIPLCTPDPDDLHTVTPTRYPHSKCLKALKRFLVQIYVNRPGMSDEDLEYARVYAIWFRKLVLDDWREKGASSDDPHFRRYSCIDVPPADLFGEVEPENWMLGQIPECEEFVFEMPSYSTGYVVEGRAGETFIYKDCRIKGYLEDMGFLRSTPMTFSSTKLSLGSEFPKYFFGLYTSCSHVELQMDLPSHAVLMLNS